MSTSRTREKADGELFKSTGIDDNATSTAITIDASENVGIGNASPLNALQIGAANPITMNGNYPDIHFNGYYAAPHYRAVTTGYATRMAFNPSNGSLSFKVGSNSTSAGANYNPIERVTLDKDGHLLVGDGITLGNGQTYAAANTLDDYEEGTWTPSITRSGISIGSYAIRYGSYTKIGNQVTLFCKVQSSTVSGGSGTWKCTGLPFAPTGTNANTTVGRNYMDADTNDRDFRIAGNVADLMITSADNGYQANTGYVIWTFTSTFQVA